MELFKDIAHIVVIGCGATLLLDLWLALLQRLGLPALNFALIGRWVGHGLRGRFVHTAINRAEAIDGERALGWLTHYGTGIAFAALLIAVQGPSWLQHPSLLPALLFGLATVVFPFFIMQPAMGMGVAAAKTPSPWKNRCKSLLNHLVFGLGLYLAAWGGAVIA